MSISTAPVNGNVSFWYADTGLPDPRPGLDGNREADVAVVGAGYTGLWTAYYLKKARPDLVRGRPRVAGSPGTAPPDATAAG